MMSVAFPAFAVLGIFAFFVLMDWLGGRFD